VSTEHVASYLSNHPISVYSYFYLNDVLIIFSRRLFGNICYLSDSKVGYTTFNRMDDLRNNRHQFSEEADADDMTIHKTLVLQSKLQIRWIKNSMTPTSAHCGIRT